MKILVVDNYDSFVFNLVHMIYDLGVANIEVRKNDQIELNEIEQFDRILLSPGPGIPKDAGKMPEIIREFGHQKSILGVCLGHQAIAEAFGGSLINLQEPLHGVASSIAVQKEDFLFNGIPKSFKIGRYHSWSVKHSVSEEIESIAIDEKQNIMAIRHKKFNLRGVQFHPESILTEHGKQIISNWINYES